jgi:hypothetical protein
VLVFDTKHRGQKLVWNRWVSWQLRHGYWVVAGRRS